MPQAKTEIALQFSECCAAEVALQKLHCNICFSAVPKSFLPKSCDAASEKLQRNIEKAALQESGAFLPLSCGFQAPTCRHPRFGPAEVNSRRPFRRFTWNEYYTNDQSRDSNRNVMNAGSTRTKYCVFRGRYDRQRTLVI